MKLTLNLQKVIQIYCTFLTLMSKWHNLSGSYIYSIHRKADLSYLC